jgi:formylmethanofuran dehydrogenase subunit E
MTSAFSEELIKKTTAFHGHWCPGLATGIRAAELALREIGKATDEDIVAVVETDMCAVDAIQYLTGCTFGKGNLIYRDYGKNAFSFYRRADGKSLRMITKAHIFGEQGETLRDLHQKMALGDLSAEEQEKWTRIREEISTKIMHSNLEDLFDLKAPSEPIPQKARILASLICANCGEPTMETRICYFNGQGYCIPCFEGLKQR